MSNKKLIFIALGVILFYAIGFGCMVWTIKKDRQEMHETNEKLLKEQSLSSTCSVTRDSLFKINTELSKYKTLTQAMLHRDEATKQLKYKIGDVVFMKNDSSRVIVEDVLIGGGKYDYYVKYRVLFKDNTTKEVKPELIY
jgi:hypothetical protein